MQNNLVRSSARRSASRRVDRDAAANKEKSRDRAWPLPKRQQDPLRSVGIKRSWWLPDRVMFPDVFFFLVQMFPDDSFVSLPISPNLHCVLRVIRSLESYMERTYLNLLRLTLTDL